jgi:hypothetical protein
MSEWKTVREVLVERTQLMRARAAALAAAERTPEWAALVEACHRVDEHVLLYGTGISDDEPKGFYHPPTET